MSRLISLFLFSFSVFLSLSRFFSLTINMPPSPTPHLYLPPFNSKTYNIFTVEIYTWLSPCNHDISRRYICNVHLNFHGNLGLIFHLNCLLQQTIQMKHQVSFCFKNRRLKIKLSSAANYIDPKTHEDNIQTQVIGDQLPTEFETRIYRTYKTS